MGCDDLLAAWGCATAVSILTFAWDVTWRGQWVLAFFCFNSCICAGCEPFSDALDVIAAGFNSHTRAGARIEWIAVGGTAVSILTPVWGAIV